MDANSKLEKLGAFWIYWKNQWRYGETDGTIGFNASNMSNHAVEGRSNGGGRGPWMEIFKIEKLSMFLVVAKEPGQIWENGWHDWTQGIKYV